MSTPLSASASRQAELDARLAAIRSEMASFGIAAGTHHHGTVQALPPTSPRTTTTPHDAARTVLDNCERRIQHLEDGVLGRALGGLTSPPIMSPGAPELALEVPIRETGLLQAEEMRRLAALRVVSEERIRRADRQMYENERDAAQLRAAQAATRDVTARAAEEEALRTALHLLADAKAGSPIPASPRYDVGVGVGVEHLSGVGLSPVGSVGGVGVGGGTHVLHTTTQVLPAASVVPLAVPQLSPQRVYMGHDFSTYGVAPAEAAAAVAAAAAAAALPPPPPPVPAPSMEAEVQARMNELLTRARLKLSCGIDLPLKAAVLGVPSTKLAPGPADVRAASSPARLNRPLSAAFTARSDDSVRRSLNATEGLLEVQRATAERNALLDRTATPRSEYNTTPHIVPNDMPSAAGTTELQRDGSRDRDASASPMSPIADEFCPDGDADEGAGGGGGEEEEYRGDAAPISGGVMTNEDTARGSVLGSAVEEEGAVLEESRLEPSEED